MKKQEKGLSEIASSINAKIKAEQNANRQNRKKNNVSETPNYYILPNGIEAKDVSGWFPANLGIAINYIWRAGKKQGNSIESDLEKAIAHLQFEIDRIVAVKNEVIKC